MARTHNLQAFKELLQAENLESKVTWELGQSEKYIKKLFFNGVEILGNGQQYNMSAKKPELFEVLQANIDAMHDLSASETKAMQRANARGNIETQKRVYIKDILNGYMELDDNELYKKQLTSIDGLIGIYGNDFNNFKIDLIKSIATKLDTIQDINGIDWKSLTVIKDLVLTNHDMDLIRKGIERYNKKFNTCYC